jgi:hypothetical protein
MKPAPSRREKSPALQELVNGWLARLSRQFDFQPSPDSLSQLSPIKKDKHRPVKPDATPGAARLLLRLLAERVVALSLVGCPSLLLDLLAGPALTGEEASLSREIAFEMGQLSDIELSGWALAGLQLWTSQTQLQKRSGSFYTSPELARHITARALAGHQPGPILDPACGGGAFLLAALEELAALEPEAPPSQWLVGRLYGLDLNPLAVVLTRLALLRRLSELAGTLDPALAIALCAQVRTGNALVGEIQPPAMGDLSLKRVELFESISAGKVAEALAHFLELEATLAASRTDLAHRIATLPIFNEPEDGPKLASLQPFGWQLEFPEVFAQTGGFAAVIGNPPYVGFNDYSGIEKAYFARTFAPVYNLKSDLFYYFIMRGVELLRPGGRLGFVISRFWKEAAFAAPLRRWLANHTRLLGIEDLGGQQFFEGAEVDVCLLFTSHEPAGPEHNFTFSFEGRAEQLAQAALVDGAPWAWLRRIPAERALLAKIAEQSVPLGEIADCRTGVQTGLDRVFFVDTAQANRLEPSVLRRAIKNAHIGPGRVEWRDLWLIYPPFDLDPAQYPALLAYLAPHRAALEHRLRYNTPFPFHQLQWPREPVLFEVPAKLVTPYKAPRNTFAVDRQQFYFSTDVISVSFRAISGIEELAANFLNSRLSTFQFRSYGKPVGGGHWDYYANPVKKLAFPRCLTEIKKPDDPLIERLAHPNFEAKEIDELVFDLYALTPSERDLILNQK